MFKIELNLTEAELNKLISVLTEFISDLSMEIADTDSMDYREKLKSDRVSIKKVIEQLQNNQQK